MIRRRAAVAMIAAAALAGCAGMTGARTMGDVYVMRHLKQEPGGGDPALSAEGAAMARALAARHWDRPFEAIFASSARRAQGTAEPLAEKLGIPVNVYNASAPDVLIEQVKQIDGPVLIVGHSNTVPDLVERLGGIAPPELAHADYGRVWRITRPNGETEVFELPTVK